MRRTIRQNMRFVIAGNLNRKRRAAIENIFENIELPQKGKRFALPKELPKTLTKPVYVHNDTVENLYFYIDTFMKRRMTDAETDALNLVNTMLTETLYSKILGTARERGLVYGMSSGLSHTRDASNWWFGAQVSDKNAPALFKIVIDELSKVMRAKLPKPKSKRPSSTPSVVSSAAPKRSAVLPTVTAVATSSTKSSKITTASRSASMPLLSSRSSRSPASYSTKRSGASACLVTVATSSPSSSVIN